VKYQGFRLIPRFSHPNCSTDAFVEVFHGNAPARTGMCYQCRRIGGSRYTLPGPGVGRGPGPRICCICFCILWYYHYLSVVQINPFIPSHSHTVNKSQSFPFGVKIFRRSVLAWGPDKLFSPGPEPAVGGPVCCGRNNGNICDCDCSQISHWSTQP